MYIQYTGCLDVAVILRVVIAWFWQIGYQVTNREQHLVQLPNEPDTLIHRLFKWRNMANDSKSNTPEGKEPQSIGKAILFLLPIYLLIGGFAIWQVRKSCLLQRDDCDYAGLLESVLSNRVLLAGSVIGLAVLLQVTWHTVGLARTGQLGVQQDPPEPKFKVNGLAVALVVFLIYLGGSFLILMGATNEVGLLHTDKPNTFVWKIMGPQYGCTLVFLVLWYLNDYFIKPASNLVLFLLFLTTFGSLYLFIKSMILS